MTAYILWLLGLILIFLELILPGAILGVMGGILVFVSAILFARDHSPLAIILYTVGLFSSIILLIRYALWRIPRTDPEYSIYSKDDQEGFVASSYDKTAIGKVGIVLTDLKPGGYILIEGKQHQALSQSGYIVKGSHVIALYGEGESLIVKNT